MLEVAIASENTDSDGEVYAAVLGLILGISVRPFRLEEFDFGGWPSVYSLAPTFLRVAADRGIRYALLAVDNDSWPEHQAGDVIPAPLFRKADLVAARSCRVCSLMAIIPADWKTAGGVSCVAVPVQTLETWLLCIDGHPFAPKTPEQKENRSHMALLCYGSKDATVIEKRRIGLELVGRPGALAILRQRPSFQRFEACVLDWKTTLASTPPPLGEQLATGGKQEQPVDVAGQR